MDGSQAGSTKVTIMGATPRAPRDGAAVASLCAALERTVQSHHSLAFRVREVVVMIEEGAPPAAPDPTPVFVDVYDSGYGHGI